MSRLSGLWILALAAIPATAPMQAAVAENIAIIELPALTPIPLQTVNDLTSKKALKGEQVSLSVAADVAIDGMLVIPKGTQAVGRIAFAQDTGAFGQSGKLRIEPLYLQISGVTVRLQGALFKKGTVTAGAAAGLVVLTPGMTGRSAKLPAGTPVDAEVMRSVTLPVSAN